VTLGVVRGRFAALCHPHLVLTASLTDAKVVVIVLRYEYEEFTLRTAPLTVLGSKDFGVGPNTSPELSLCIINDKVVSPRNHCHHVPRFFISSHGTAPFLVAWLRRFINDGSAFPLTTISKLIAFSTQQFKELFYPGHTFGLKLGQSFEGAVRG
jgi:hypothetical protein